MNKTTILLLMGVILIVVISAGIVVDNLNNGTKVHFPEDGAITGDSILLMDTSAPAQTETATFALGCFWAPDSIFGSLDGVVRTRVGYAGGTLENPTYYNLGDHTETIQIDYDPAQVSYEQLLEVYWDNHNPTIQHRSRQYMSIVFYHNSEQRMLAMASKEDEEASLGRGVYTDIVPFPEFYLAEDYHQKYHLQQVPGLMEELVDIYPNFTVLVDSTAAARINGYAGGHITFQQLRERLDPYRPVSG